MINSASAIVPQIIGEKGLDAPAGCESPDRHTGSRFRHSNRRSQPVAEVAGTSRTCPTNEVGQVCGLPFSGGRTISAPGCECRESDVRHMERLWGGCLLCTQRRAPDRLVRLDHHTRKWRPTRASAAVQGDRLGGTAPRRGFLQIQQPTALTNDEERLWRRKLAPFLKNALRWVCLRGEKARAMGFRLTVAFGDSAASEPGGTATAGRPLRCPDASVKKRSGSWAAAYLSW